MATVRGRQGSRPTPCAVRPAVPAAGSLQKPRGFRRTAHGVCLAAFLCDMHKRAVPGWPCCCSFSPLFAALFRRGATRPPRNTAGLSLSIDPSTSACHRSDASPGLRRPRPPSPQRIQRLIEALGDADYFVRQKAEPYLGKLGFDAVEGATAAAEHDDMEIATRANRLLSTIRSKGASRASPPSFRKCWPITNRRTTATAKPCSAN